MDNRKFQAASSASPPAVEASPSTGYPTDGNPSTATPATIPGARWFHQIGEELRGIITAAGLTPSDSDLTQLQQAVTAMINQGGIKTSVRASTTANIVNLAGGAPNTLDGVTLAANDRILVKDQSTGSQNGIYVVTTLGTGVNGTWTRATDADGVGELIAGSLVTVAEGTLNADTIRELSTDGAITIGTTALTFALVGGVFTHLFSGSGYSKLPGGLILQWKPVAAVVGTDFSGSWPIAFPNAILCLSTRTDYAAGSGTITNVSVNGTATGYTGRASGTITVAILAIGY